MKPIYKITVTTITAVALGISTAGMASAHEIAKSPNNLTTSIVNVDKSFESSSEALAFYTLFNYYEKIPDSVLEAGDEALAPMAKR